MFSAKEFWNQLADHYEANNQKGTLVGAVALYLATNSLKAKNILEVACGTGLPSKIFIESYMNKGASYFCCDFAEKMVEKARKEINKLNDVNFSHIELDI